METDRGVAAGWYPDPVGDHELRYHNGVRWTGDVSTHGERFVAPLVPTPDARSRPAGRFALGAGIAAVAIAWIPFVCVIGAALALVAIVSGLRGRADPVVGSSATTGLAMGCFALVLAAGGAWLSVVAFRAVDDHLDPGEHLVTLDSCDEVDGGTQATGTITNGSGDDRTYVVEVEFEPGRSADTTVADVAAGETASFVIDEDLRFADLSCRVVSVTGPAPFGIDLDG